MKFDILVEISHSTSSKNVFPDSIGRSQCDLFSNNECDWCGKKRTKNRRYDEDFMRTSLSQILTDTEK